MTKEEAKNWLKKLYMRTDITDEYGDMEDMQPYEEAVNMAIKSLQEPFINKPCVSEGACKYYIEYVLDKIRAEITDAEKCWYGVNDCFVKLSDVLKILDKCKIESGEICNDD